MRVVQGEGVPDPSFVIGRSVVAPLRISVCVACYDEAATLERAVAEALEALAALGGDGHEVLIIDDGSTDGSGAIADRLAASHDGIRVAHHARNLGLGGFYRTALREARGDALYFMAADLQPIPGEYFPRFVPLLDRHDVVVGFDLRREAPPLSRLLSWGEGVLFGFLFPGVPKIGGPLMIKRSVVEAFDLQLARDDDRSWIVLWELVVRAKRAGFRFARVPVRRRPREVGSTRGSTIRTAAIMLRRLHSLRGMLAAPSRPRSSIV
jgi:dolichol-phosphate mannosyltransferase